MLNDSYYLFVEVAAQRCSQLMRGAKPKVELRAHKYTTIACAEVREDLIPWQTASDEQIAAEIAAAAAEEAASQDTGAQIPTVLERPADDEEE